LGIEHESFDYGPAGSSGGSGGSGGSDEDSDEDSDEEESESWVDSSYLFPITILFIGGAAYYYRDQLIQISKRIM